MLNPILMLPYVINAMVLTASSYLLMEWGLVGRPVVGIPWTTPPVIGHYLVTGGDWRAAVLGVVRGFDADLLGTQETLAFQRDELLASLPAFAVVAAGRDDGARQRRTSS